MATENFESKHCMSEYWEAVLFVVCHMCQLNQVDCVDFWRIFQYHSLVSILNISTSSLPLKLGGGGERCILGCFQ